MSEEEIRKTLAEVDALRVRATVAERMHTHWMMHDGELVEVHEITLRQRWRSPKTTHSEIILTVEERDLIRDWLMTRASDLTQRANELAKTLESAEQ